MVRLLGLRVARLEALDVIALMRFCLGFPFWHRSAALALVFLYAPLAYLGLRMAHRARLGRFQAQERAANVHEAVCPDPGWRSASWSSACTRTGRSGGRPRTWLGHDRGREGPVVRPARDGLLPGGLPAHRTQSFAPRAARGSPSLPSPVHGSRGGRHPSNLACIYQALLNAVRSSP